MSETNPMPENEEVKELQAQNLSLEDHIKQLIEKREALLEQAKEIRAGVEAAEDGVELEFFEKNKEKFAEVQLPDLVVMGSATFSGKIGRFAEYTIGNLTKSQSLEIDGMIKDLRSQTQQYGDQYIRMQILARAVRRFGPVDQTKSLPEDAKESFEILGTLDENVLSILWDEYQNFARWIRAAMKFELKNS